jgi:hypothetical protein
LTQEPDIPHLLKSVITPAKELDCILIFDPETNEYVLERQHSSFNFQRIRKEHIKGHHRSLSQDSTTASQGETTPIPTQSQEEEVLELEEDSFDELDKIVAETIEEPVSQSDGPRSLFNQEGIPSSVDDDGSSSVDGE